jgi:SAM-dependent methyltransferase
MSHADPDYNEFYDPRLVAVYNTICALGDEKEFYINLAKDLSVKTIVDLGCGTGLLTIELANLGYKMIGVEPSKFMLDVAQKNSKDLEIQWIHGDAATLEEFNADLVIMTGHVAQFHIDDEQWKNALKSINKALKDGGYLAFESRNPDVQPWNNPNQEGNTDWYAPNFHKDFYDPNEGKIEYRAKLLEVDGEKATSEGQYLFIKTGEKLTSANTLIFRTREEVENSLKDAGFSIEKVYGNWDGSLANEESPEYIFVAKKS